MTPEQDLHNIEIGVLDCLHRHTTENGIDKPGVARELAKWIQKSVASSGGGEKPTCPRCVNGKNHPGEVETIYRCKWCGEQFPAPKKGRE